MKQDAVYIKLSIILLMITILMAIAWTPPDASQTQTMASVIVQGTSADELAAAITQHGGRVTQELVLIHGVVAQVPASAIDQLEAHPAVQRIWLNSSVSKAGLNPPNLGSHL